MKIRLKLTLLFTLLFAILLAVFAAVTYFSYAENREDSFFERLEQRAIVQANLLMDVGVAPNVLQLIYKNVPNNEEVAIYDTAFNLMYHDDAVGDRVKETPEMMRQIIKHHNIRFNIGKNQVVGFLYKYKEKYFIITAAAVDVAGYRKLENLQITLLAGFLIAIALTLVAGRFFSKKALSPVSHMVDRVEDITATNLHMRVQEGNRKDEIAVLAITFNRMLNRLEQSFESQKQFVSNISHELRTPLAAIVAELELSAIRPRTTDEYQEVIIRVSSDARKLVRLSNDLLDFAKASYDPDQIKFKNLRLDELLLDARLQILKANTDYHININFEEEMEIGDDRFISLNGNEYLLKVAFGNLMENGCKFSGNHQCSVTIRLSENSVFVRIADTGVGITPEDLPHIFEPFYRGNNKQYASGNGIGLSLTDRIIRLHKGQISVQSKPGEGTTFLVEIPHIPAL